MTKKPSPTKASSFKDIGSLFHKQPSQADANRPGAGMQGPLKLAEGGPASDAELLRQNGPGDWRGMDNAKESIGRLLEGSIDDPGSVAHAKYRVTKDAYADESRGRDVIQKSETRMGDQNDFMPDAKAPDLGNPRTESYRSEPATRSKSESEKYGSQKRKPSSSSASSFRPPEGKSMAGFKTHRVAAKYESDDSMPLTGGTKSDKERLLKQIPK